MDNRYTKTQINNLGDRLRHGELTAEDIKILDVYRRSFRNAYETTIHVLRENLYLEPTGRPAKSTSSIIEKLEREKSRLATIQDIAGCRIVLKDCKEQDDLIKKLHEYFPQSKIVDRRIKPSFGYRAVHFIAFVDDKPIEIQIRTTLQHLWAELSERLADIFRPIKYGGGPPRIRSVLDPLSDEVTEYERVEMRILTFTTPTTQKDVDALDDLRKDIEKLKISIEDHLKDLIKILE